MKAALPPPPPPLLLLLLLSAALIPTAAGGRSKEKDKPAQRGSECTDWRYGNCAPSNGDCGAGFREGSCDRQTNTMKCKVPCDWKKDFGADCKYRFGSWGDCDPAAGSRSRTGTLKRALYAAECRRTVTASKPCRRGEEAGEARRAGTDKFVPALGPGRDQGTLWERGFSLKHLAVDLVVRREGGGRINKSLWLTFALLYG